MDLANPGTVPGRIRIVLYGLLVLVQKATIRSRISMKLLLTSGMCILKIWWQEQVLECISCEYCDTTMVLDMLFHSLVFPIFMFSVEVWGCAGHSKYLIYIDPVTL